MNRIAALLCIIVALGLLYPGVTQPVLTLSGSVEKSDLSRLGIDLLVGDSENSQAHAMLTNMSTLLGLNRIEGQLEIYRNTRSIWGTVDSLAAAGNWLVAFLIAFFSICVPLFKLLLQLVALLLPPSVLRHWLWRVNGAVSKWSMADVFVMALMVAYLAGGAADQMGNLLVTQAQLGVGFYYFLAYCIFSIAAGGLLRDADRAQ